MLRTSVKILGLVLLLSLASFLYAQGNRYDNVVFHSGVGIAGANVAICAPAPTVSAVANGSLLIFTMASNPQTAGFAVGGTLMVTGFTGADTVFNAGSISSNIVVNGLPIIGVTPSTVVVPSSLTQTATSNGTLLQMGNSTTPCAGLIPLFTDSTLTVASGNPVISDGNGNYGFWAASGQYYEQFYGATVSTTIKFVSLASIVSSSTGSTIGGNLNVKGPTPWTDATQFGVRMWSNSNFQNIVATTSGTSVSTTGIVDFIVNDGIVIPTAGAPTTQSTPSAPTVTPIGATGSTSISYQCVGVDAHWGLTAASAATTTTTAPQVFGWPAVAITSISRSSNVVTVTVSSNFQVSSGTFHAVIANVTGGTTQFSGLQLVTVTSGTSLTYSQTGANESGTVGAGSYILFKNAFVLTNVASTAGSNQLVLTTDVNHNIPFISSGTRPVRIYLDGIQFTAAPAQGYANGTNGVAAVTSNTITVNTPYTSPITTTGVANASLSYATSGVAQMTATVYPVIDVACPALPSGTTQFYAVYANYGSGYIPIGFTPWGTNIFEDYGPAFTSAGLHLPPAMNLPSTPPASAQNQVYTGQVTGISGTTLTVTPTVPTVVTSVTSYHDNGVPLLNALIAASSDNGANNNASGRGVVYIPRMVPSGGGISYMLINAPIDLSSAVNRVRLLFGSPLWLNGTLIGGNSGILEMKSAKELSGWSVISTGANSHGQNYIFGYAPTMIVSPPFALDLSGFAVTISSNGQVGLMVSGTANADIEDSSFASTVSPDLSAIPLYIYNATFGVQLHDITLSMNAAIMAPVPQIGDPPLGEVAFWTVPAVEITGAFNPKFKMDGINYAVNRGIQFDDLYANSHTSSFADISDVDTFQSPQQAFVTVYGGDILEHLSLTRVIGDSVSNPPVAAITSNNGGAAITYYGENSQGTGAEGVLSGAAFRAAVEVLSHGGPAAQNTNEISENSPANVNITTPVTFASHFNSASSTDFSGTVTITSSTSVAVAFKSNFTGTSAPLVVLTPTTSPATAGVYWVTLTGSSGAWTEFTINITNSTTISFNYVVIGHIS